MRANSFSVNRRIPAYAVLALLVLADHVSSITFNASTRTIGGTEAAGDRYAVTFIATDEDGAVAKGYTEVRHGVGGL